MILAFTFLLLCYGFLLLKFYRGYQTLVKQNKDLATEQTQPPKTTFTIIIPYRNEALHLPKLLESLSRLNYPISLFEIIMVNDESEDASQKIVMEKGLENLSNTQNKRSSASPKKDAITTAIGLAKNDWMVTTDADCIVPENWLQTLDSYIQKTNPNMICGPVIYNSDNSFLQDFQRLDGLSLQGITMGSFGNLNPLLNNGAHLAYKKTTFKTLDGFQGNDHIASGDDIFMLEKVKAHDPEGLQYLFVQDAIVQTHSETTWRALISQRVRWASKTSKTKNKNSVWIGLLVFLCNFIAILLPVITFLTPSFWGFTLLFWSFKISADFLFINQLQSFFSTNISVLRMLQSGLLYPFISCWVVLQSMSGNYDWKGRQYKK